MSVTETFELAEAVGAGADEVAQFVAFIVPGLTEEQAVALRGLVGNSIAAPSPAVLRYERLGLFIEMIRDLRRSPRIDEYDAECGRRITLGESWDYSHVLINAYGHWDNVIGAADRFDRMGSAGRVPDSYRHARRGEDPLPPYLHDEVIWAIQRCRKALGGTWPSCWEYLTWARLERRIARRYDADNPARLPHMRPIRRLFGTWAAGLEAAIRDARA